MSADLDNPDIHARYLGDLRFFDLDVKFNRLRGRLEGKLDKLYDVDPVTGEHVRRRDGFDFVVQGSGFLYNMVRNLVGTLLEVGYGNRPPEWVREVLDGADRRLAGATAPARGLYLLRVLYGDDLSVPAGKEPGR